MKPASCKDKLRHDVFAGIQKSQLVDDEDKVRSDFNIQLCHVIKQQKIRLLYKATLTGRLPVVDSFRRVEQMLLNRARRSHIDAGQSAMRFVQLPRRSCQQEALDIVLQQQRLQTSVYFRYDQL